MAAPLTQKECEVELFTLLKSANLLDYYQSFIEQGGDDLQQLCDATDDEFKEIIGMVGMSSKPLHVRRLQKALVEWKAKKARGRDKSPEKASSWIDCWSPTQSPSVSRTTATVTSPAFVTPGSRKRVSSSGSSSGKAEKRVVELKLPPMDVIIDWEKLDPERQALIREHSKIYGRDDKKRKSSALNCHEQMINEAAAQLCLRDPTLLVRRDELFTMARRVVRDSGFTYVHGHSRSKFVSSTSDDELTVEGLVQNLVQQGKKPNQAQINKLKRLERLNEIDTFLASNKDQQEDVARKIEDARTIGNAQEINEYQVEMQKLQSDQVNMQLEQKELRKKQRRSERYYSNKETKDPLDDDEPEPADGNDDSVVEDVTFVEDAVGPVAEADATHAAVHPEHAAAVVTEILPPASDTAAATTSVAMQRADNISDHENTVRALYSTFQLSNEAQQNAAANIAAFQQSLVARAHEQGFATGATSITDPTINALLSLSTKDKGMVQGVNLQAVPMSVAVTGPQGTQSTVLTSPNITVVMPAGHPLPANMQWT